MPTYKKTIKKYNNRKSNKSQKTQNIKNKTEKLLKTDKNNYSTGNKKENELTQKNDNQIVVANSKKLENEVPEKSNNHPKNSNLKESQNQDTIAHKKDRTKSLSYCIIAVIITILAIILIGKSVFNKILVSNNPDILLCGNAAGISLFFVFYACLLISVCLITLSNKTDNHAYEIDITLYTILLILCFTFSLLLYGFELFLPAAIISVIATSLSMYMCYRYYVSFIWSGIIQTIATLILLYSSYVTLAFSL